MSWAYTYFVAVFQDVAGMMQNIGVLAASCLVIVFGVAVAFYLGRKLFRRARRSI